MALIDDIAAIGPTKHRTFEAWLASEPDDAAEALEAIRDTTLPIDPLLRALRKNGIPCTRATVKAYRDVAD